MDDSPKKPAALLKAYEDIEFLKSDAARPVRLQLELMHPEVMMQKHKIESTIVVFGSARTLPPEVAEEQLRVLEDQAAKTPNDPDLARQLTRARRGVDHSKYYVEAQKFGKMVTEACQNHVSCRFVVSTGGGPGIMEAANRGAFEAGGKSIGLNISLPFEQYPNPYITPDLSFEFHYFSMRKMHFLLRAKAIVAFPGGFGTMDELFEALTLVQTKKIKPMPIVLCGKGFWQRFLDFQFLVDEGTISESDLNLFKIVETAEEAWAEISAFYQVDTH
ncbi:MAG: TIGR00730 family Rossman fold protein [Verrucomicrobiota bacterium]|nr:TIGR00730 family Rossman fold protein [Verrucomicrobiota bacterium]